MSEGLKPCPFCGTTEEDLEFRFSYASKFTKPFLFVGCLKCGGMMLDTNTDHCLNDVKRAWNRRAGERIKDLPFAQPETHEKRTETHACDLISRQASIDAVGSMLRRKFGVGGDLAEITLTGLPSAQPERDIPKKPTETTDKTWGIPHRQAVCPNCDCYLVDVYFIDGSKHKVTYCESCGQAIDWEGWEQDEIDRR